MKRIRIIMILFAISGIVLWGRIFWLQTVCAEELRGIKDKQSLCSVTLTEENRGEILDCNQQSLTATENSLSLVIIPALIKDAESTADKLCDLFGFDKKLLLQKITGENDKNIRLKPFIALPYLTAEEVSRLEKANIEGIAAVITSERWQKAYPAQHLLGSLTVNEKNEICGTSGLEKIYNKEIEGNQSGTLRFRIDDRNTLDFNDYFYKSKGLTNRSSVSLTIDSAIQNAAESALGSREGSVIVLDSQNGDVLAMVSSPKYDPYGLKKNPDACYVNKAVSSVPPASLFKVFTAAVALEHHIVTEETPFVCNGGISFKSGQTVSCWEHKGHGIIAFGDAVAQSCNPVLIQTAKAVGTKKLLREFKKWELGDDRLIGYPLRATSEMKTPQSDIELANITLGEDGIRLTPLNVAKMLNVIASDGYVMTPRVVTEVRDQSGSLKETFSSSLPVRVISRQTAATMKNILKKTFIYGTASGLGLENEDIAGKTGSSETGNVWLGGFFPVNHPQYTVAVMIKNGSGGAADAGPVFKKLFLLLNKN